MTTGRLRYATVCSGIEAASQAWQPLGWEPVFFSEIDPFPCAYLAHHHPDVPNLGDMTKWKDWPDANVDVLAGGTPCQSFSVAGLRKGLADPRGNLMLTFGAIAGRYRPRWVVWENVPGVLSSNGGRDFGTFLGMLGELGYGVAYRVLDAQHVRTRRFPRAVPQRRRRVFVVGYLGDWRRAAAVFFDGESLRGHPPPRREAGEVAPTVPSRSSAGGGLGTDFDCDGGLVTLTDGFEVCGALSDGAHNGGGLNGQVAYTGRILPVAHALRGEGFDASEDGTGRQNLVTVAFHNRQDPDVSGDVTHPLGARDNGMAIAFSAKDHGADAAENVSPTLRAGGHADSHQNGGVMPAVATEWAVRRLTPVECERLMAFPDGATAIPYRGKPASDGPRYRALGNSWAVNCAEWIGERIALVDAMTGADVAAQKDAPTPTPSPQSGKS